LNCDQNVKTFDPAKQGMSEAARLFAIDSVVVGGLVKKEFWKLFLKCQVCQNFMTARSVGSHVCPASGVPVGHGTSLFLIGPMHALTTANRCSA
jgi:hypothetical protein